MKTFEIHSLKMALVLALILFVSVNASGQDYSNLYRKSKEAQDNAIEDTAEKYAKKDAEKQAVYKELLEEAFKQYWLVDSVKTTYRTDTLERLKKTLDDARKSIDKCNEEINDSSGSYKKLNTELTRVQAELHQKIEERSKSVGDKHEKNQHIIDSITAKNREYQESINKANDSIRDLADTTAIAVRIRVLQDSIAILKGVNGQIDGMKNDMSAFCESMKRAETDLRRKSILEGNSGSESITVLLGQYDAKRESIKLMLPEKVADLDLTAAYLRDVLELRKLVQEAITQMGEKFDAAKNKAIAAKIRARNSSNIKDKQKQDLNNLCNALDNQEAAYKNLLQTIDMLAKTTTCVPEDADRNSLNLPAKISASIKSYTKSSKPEYNSYYTRLNAAVRKMMEELAPNSKFPIENIYTEEDWSKYLTNIKNNL